MLKIPQVEELGFCLLFYQDGPSVSFSVISLWKVAY